ncbi:hypothetical protein [Aeromicrobium sp. Leaf350]|uniref:hypothetical protein n=1 Tax=Aeromicrobium sp. Leaf350 TaxID=2876565 RepID=UPI001E53B4DE|nr:hypothetical protein [Aeromicrobium sp. Leaf350]
MKLRWVVAGSLALVGVVAATTLHDREPNRAEYCVAEVEGTRAQVDLEQARWSSLMAAMAQNRGLPPRATTIAIATAFQESRIHNIDYGDRDSVGLFQQRPSQGWGTVEQIMDPRYSIGGFYDGLVQVADYTTLEITAAAQAVQRSAFPEAYAQHEPASRSLASALRGYSPAAFTCQLNDEGGGSATGVLDDVNAAFGSLGGVVDGDSVVTRFTGPAEDTVIRGWALAQYAVANASHLGISSVSFDGRAWTVEDSPEGWVESPDAAADTVVIRTR